MARTHGKTIRIRTRNLAEVADFVTQEIPRLYRGVFAHQVAESLVIALKVEPPYKYVSRFSAYGLQDGGPGWFSDKQRRYVMAMIRKGVITPGTSQRTGTTSAGWHVESKGAKSVIVNTTEGARWTQNNYWQARQPARVGWHKAGDTIDKNLDDAMLDGIDAVVEKMEAR
jgi:hypothetical protein